MASSKLLSFFCFIVLHPVALTTAQQNKPLLHICSDKNGNFTRRSPYQVNLNRLLPSLSTKTSINYGFVNASNGVNSGTVNAMALCRGDVKPATCRGCINNSTRELRKSCPNQKEAIIWYDYCMLRYSNRHFFRNMEFGPYFWAYGMQNASNARTFNRVLQILLNSLRNKAASGDSHLKFATGNATASKSETIHALVQCTPDLSKQQCRECLSNATALLPKCCDGKRGGRVVAPSCNFRYEIGRFYK
ncbi:Cysteine-rich receptor-kinase-like protein [Melia azedarach]|uniref:Cysteine-rich receptor-kinase-like protein n=1 Tax=Melia azedarach TaxID=155640 RepID=A0ACC1WWG1_MELAZ|nr:Cysteine-rich receptor-kinase-like protein [Melia azedarach]